jgi:hydrogenase-4 transcriptional activator
MREFVFVRSLRFDERSELERMASSEDEDAARRARIVLMSSERRTVREIAEVVGSHPINVKKWVRRFNGEGPSGLKEYKRGPKKGTRFRFSEEQERSLLALAAESPRALGYDFDRWSPQKLADAAVARGIVGKISHVTVRGMIQRAGLDGRSKPLAGGNGEDRAAIVLDGEEAEDVGALIETGRLALAKGDNRAAAEAFREALETGGLSLVTEAGVRCRLAEALGGLASYEEALEAIRKYDDPAALSTLPLELRGKVRIRLGWVYSWLRNYARAIARLNEAIKIFRESEDVESLAEAHYTLGRTYVMGINESSMARDHLERAIELQRHSGNRHFLAQVYLRLGVVEFNEGNIDKATGFWESARELAEGSTDDNLLGQISVNLATARIHADRGERDKATEDLEHAIYHFGRCGNQAFLAQAYNNLGDNLRYAGDWGRALESLEKSLEIAHEVADLRYRADPLITIAEIVARKGDYHLAYSKISNALELMRKIEDRWGETYALRVFGWVYHRLEQPLQALRILRESLHLATSVKDLRGVTAAHLLLAELHVAEERYEQAEEYIELALGALKADPSQLRSSGLARRLSGRLDLVRGRFLEGQQQIAQSISIFTAVADIYEVGLSHLEMGDLLGRMGDKEQARQHLDQAIAIFTRLGAAPDLVRASELLSRPEPVASAGDARTTGSGDHKASDVLLMQRLLDASASRDLLIQELVSIVGENFAPGRIALFAQTGGGDIRSELLHGFTEQEATAIAGDISWSLASGRRLAAGALYTLDDRSGTRMVLFLERVVSNDRLRPLLRQAELGLENCALREQGRRVTESVVGSRTRAEAVIPGFIFASEAMREVIERIHKIRTSDVTVLITGESGTGKELVARAIHAESERRRAAFLPFNCTAMPKEIIDSQLFGHRRGAFTGATSNYPGIIRASEGGTLFLDEIGDLALEVQPKLLRFLESGEIQPLGEAKPSKVDVRVVAATNTDLERAVDEGRFREDLFHRLNIIRIHVPPLRERRDEIPVLAEYFLKHFADRSGKPGLSLADTAMEVLTRYGWPGNVRQLRNEMERVVAYSAAGAKTRIGAGDLSPELVARVSQHRSERGAGSGPYDGMRPSRDEGTTLRLSLKEATARLERSLIEDALSRARWDLSRAARELGMSPKGLHLKMTQLGIPRSAGESDYL